MSLTNSEETLVRKQDSVDIWQIIPLVLAAALVTIGLAMFLGGTANVQDVVRPVVVVFGGATVSLLLTFTPSQILQSLNAALIRGIRGGTAPSEMVRALLKVSEISRRDGLLGVAEIRTSCAELEEVCHLIGDAAEDSAIQFALERRLAGERLYHQMVSDVVIFTALYALLLGLSGTLLSYVGIDDEQASGNWILPFVCGASLAIIVTILLGRLRSYHTRELVITEIAYRGAAMILEDNNVPRLQARLVRLVPPGF